MDDAGSFELDYLSWLRLTVGSIEFSFVELSCEDSLNGQECEAQLNPTAPAQLPFFVQVGQSKGFSGQRRGGLARGNRVEFLQRIFAESDRSSGLHRVVPQQLHLQPILAGKEAPTVRKLKGSCANKNSLKNCRKLSDIFSLGCCAQWS